MCIWKSILQNAGHFVKLQWNIKKNLYILIKENAFENDVCNMAAILSLPQCGKSSQAIGDLTHHDAQYVTSPVVNGALLSCINPLCAKFFRGNINIYLHFVSLLHIDIAQVLKILSQVRPGHTYST